MNYAVTKTFADNKCGLRWHFRKDKASWDSNVDRKPTVDLTDTKIYLLYYTFDVPGANSVVWLMRGKREFEREGATREKIKPLLRGRLKILWPVFEAYARML